VTQAFGHAEYDFSTPGDGEVVTAAPTQVEVHFTEDLAPGGPNSLNVLDPSNADVDNNDLVVGTDTMTVTLQGGLTAGVYTVEWHSTSDDDGDEAEDTFQFTYSPVTVGGVGELPNFDQTLGGDGSGLSWQAVLLAAGALGLLAAAGGRLLLGRRRA
jgi:methionine-rich copper-binding protein CopC